MKVKSQSEVAQSCLTLSDPMGCSLPGSSVHGIFQARVLEWGAARGMLGSGRTHGVSFRPFLNSSGWWWLINSVFLAETTSAEEAKHSRRPTQRVVEAEGEENPAQGKAHHAGNRDSEKQTQQKAHAAQSQIPEDLRLR